MSRNDDMEFLCQDNLVVMKFRTQYNEFIVIRNTSMYSGRRLLGIPRESGFCPV